MKDSRLKFVNGKQKEFLAAVIKDHFGSQAALARFLGFHKRAVCGWIAEENNIPKSTFQKIEQLYPEYKSYETFVEKELPHNWGRVKGGKMRVSQNKDLSNYLKYVRSFVHNRNRKKPVLADIENLLLKRLSDEKVDLLSILAVCTLTDGSLVKSCNSYRISFSSSDEVLIDFVYALIGKLSGFYPNINLGSKGGKIVSISEPDLGRNLLKLSPEYRTFAIDENSPPSISFLFDKNFQTKVWAIRFAFTTDGCISVPKNGKAELNLACYNKNLCEEWKRFLEEFGIKANIIRLKKAKQGVAGVRAYRVESINNFYKLGGFIDKVKISRKSKRYCGMEKNALLASVIKSGQGENRTPNRSIISRVLNH